LILLDPVVDHTLTALSHDQQSILQSEDVKVTKTTIQIGYDDMTTDEVLKKLLPEGLEVVTAFEAVGHIAHMNLRTECLPFRHLIGQVILDKNKTISTVVNKTGQIDTVFRTFKMELLAGIDKMEAEVHESGCRFQFNFAEVYWNSRLGTEHERLVKLFKPGQIVADMFCGVGPFAVPAAKQGCVVHANDLNSRSYHYLQQNGTLNKCSQNLKCYNMDGRDFIKALVHGSEEVQKLPRIDHVIMNLPASAVSFLDVFDQLFPGTINPNDLPIIHCYGFSTASDVFQDILQQCETAIGHPLLTPDITIVRNVSPHKFMMRVSVKLPASCLDMRVLDEPQPKRQKTES